MHTLAYCIVTCKWLTTVKLTWPSKYCIFKYTNVVLYFFILIEKYIDYLFSKSLTLLSKKLINCSHRVKKAFDDILKRLFKINTLSLLRRFRKSYKTKHMLHFEKFSICVFKNSRKSVSLWITKQERLKGFISRIKYRGTYFAERERERERESVYEFILIIKLLYRWVTMSWIKGPNAPWCFH